MTDQNTTQHVVMSADDTMQIDTKIDDGLPLAGAARASGIGWNGSSTSFILPNPTCVQSVGGNTVYATGSITACTMMIKAKF